MNIGCIPVNVGFSVPHQLIEINYLTYPTNNKSSPVFIQSNTSYIKTHDRVCSITSSNIFKQVYTETYKVKLSTKDFRTLIIQAIGCYMIDEQSVETKADECPRNSHSDDTISALRVGSDQANVCTYLSLSTLSLYATMIFVLLNGKTQFCK